ncbi:hypothetical protein V6N12_028690 [Hibiscus sabdariffa]|uniref:Uncharacterized protein n=1 Tax=Hibiscus sabdariffa TaxID=183260 RepID=A0ABR2F6J7_9ROSI
MVCHNIASPGTNRVAGDGQNIVSASPGTNQVVAPASAGECDQSLSLSTNGTNSFSANDANSQSLSLPANGVNSLPVDSAQYQSQGSIGLSQQSDDLTETVVHDITSYSGIANFVPMNQPRFN